MTTPIPDPILKARQQVARHANAAGLSLQEFAKAMNTHLGTLVVSPITTTPSAAYAVAAQQTRQDRLEELYHQDGRQNPSHPMHGLYTGLEQTTTTTTPENAMADNFVFLTLNPKGRRIAIRKSSVHNFFDADNYGTIVEYTGDSSWVEESFDEVCRLLGIDTTQQEPKP